MKLTCILESKEKGLFLALEEPDMTDEGIGFVLWQVDQGSHRT